MTSRVVFLPTTPLLFPQIATGAADELSDVRDAARAAVQWACDDAATVAVVTRHTEPPAQKPTWALAGYGLTVGDGPAVPLAIAVARWLLQRRVPRVLSPQDAAVTEHDAVLVMGDGSAARSEKAPLHLDPDAVACDDLAVRALAQGDVPALRRLDLDVCARVGATGPALWASVAGRVDRVESGTVDLTADPYGVLYVVARWSVRWAAPA